MIFRRFLFVLLFFLPALSLFAENTIDIDPLGKVRIIQGGPSPTHVIIVISGAEGWKGEVVELAKTLSSADNLVFGVDYNDYLNHLKDDRYTCQCGDLARLSLYMQKQKGFKKYIPPVLIGNAEGAEIVYAAIAQAPEAFMGGISLGFCPAYADARRMCSGKGLASVKKHGGDDSFQPYKELDTPWAMVPAASCDKPARRFASEIQTAQVLETKNSRGEKIRDLVSQWQVAYKGEQANALGLPLVPYPPGNANDVLFVILSGDGGWTSLDRDMGDYLSQNGMSVVGFDMLQYLWTEPTPEQGGKDLDRIISYYLTQWKKNRAVLVGFSMGADALVLTVPELSPETNKKVSGVALIGPARRSKLALTISLSKIEEPSTGDFLLPHIKRVSVPVLCIGGTIEKESLCRQAENKGGLPKNVQVDVVKAGHMFHDAYAQISQMVSDHFGLSLKLKE